MYVRTFHSLRQHRARSLAFAGLTLTLAILLRFILPEGCPPFITIAPAVVICSVLSGIWAGSGAAAIGGGFAWYFWTDPYGSWTQLWPTGWLTFSLYVFDCILMIGAVYGLERLILAVSGERERSALLLEELQHRVA